MDALKEILTLVLTPASILLGLVFILRKFFEQGLARDIERFRATLQAEFEQSKLKLENELQTKYFEFQTKFSSYHQKQIEVVGEIFEMLNEAEITVGELVHPMRIADTGREVELIGEADTKCIALARFFNKNRIYLDEETCQQLDSILREMRKALVRFDVSHKNIKGNPDSDLWMSAWKLVEEEIPPLKKALETRVRKNLSTLAAMPSDTAPSANPK
jgi:hypothetical protein